MIRFGRAVPETICRIWDTCGLNMKYDRVSRSVGRLRAPTPEDRWRIIGATRDGAQGVCGFMFDSMFQFQSLLWFNMCECVQSGRRDATRRVSVESRVVSRD